MYGLYKHGVLQFDRAGQLLVFVNKALAVNAMAVYPDLMLMACGSK